MRTLIFAFVLLSNAAYAQTIGDLGWLKGCWRTSGETIVTESWIAPPADVMFGQAITQKTGKTIFWEDLRIEARDGQLAYVAMPGGRGPVRFPAIENAPNRIVFENLAHDFPQRIAYVRDGKTLTAVTSAGDQAETFTYRRIRYPAGSKP